MAYPFFSLRPRPRGLPEGQLALPTVPDAVGAVHARGQRRRPQPGTGYEIPESGLQRK